MDSFDREALAGLGALSAVLFHSTLFLDLLVPVSALLLTSVPCSSQIACFPPKDNRTQSIGAMATRCLLLSMALC